MEDLLKPTNSFQMIDYYNQILLYLHRRHTFTPLAKSVHDLPEVPNLNSHIHHLNQIDLLDEKINKDLRKSLYLSHYGLKLFDQLPYEYFGNPYGFYLKQSEEKPLKKKQSIIEKIKENAIVSIVSAAVGAISGFLLGLAL